MKRVVLICLVLAACGDSTGAPDPPEWHWVASEARTVGGELLPNPAFVSDSEPIVVRFKIENTGGPDSLLMGLWTEEWNERPPYPGPAGGVEPDPNPPPWSTGRILVFDEVWYEFRVYVFGPWQLEPYAVPPAHVGEELRFDGPVLFVEGTPDRQP